MTVQPQQPEQQPSGPEQKPPVSPLKPETPKDDLSVKFAESVDEKTKAYEKKSEEQAKKYKARWSIAETKQMLISDRHINELRRAAAAKKKEFADLQPGLKAERFNVLLQQTEQELSDIYLPYEKIIDHVRGLDKLDEAELVKLEALLKALNKMKTSPELEKLFLKAMSKEKLDPKEMQMLVARINPVDLNQSLEKGKADEIFEASQIGAIISVMRADQKIELLDAIVESKPPQEVNSILKVLLVTGQISNVQLLYLLDKGKVPEPYAGELRKEMEGGKILEQQAEYNRKLDQLTDVNKGRTPGNPLSKAAGAPAAFGLAALWGAAVALVNFKINMDWSKPLQSLATIGTSPHFLLGLGAMGVGVAGTAPIVAPETFDKYKDKAVDFFSGPEAKKAKADAREANLKGFLDAQLQRNPYLTRFLTEQEEIAGKKKTGLEIIHDIVADKKAQNKEVRFEIEDLKARAGSKQRQWLDRAYGAEGGKQINLQDSLRMLMGTLYQLKMDDPVSLEKAVRELNIKQGIA